MIEPALIQKVGQSDVRVLRSFANRVSSPAGLAFPVRGQIFIVDHSLLLPWISWGCLPALCQRFANLALYLHVHLRQGTRPTEGRDKAVSAAIPPYIELFPNLLTANHLGDPPKASPA